MAVDEHAGVESVDSVTVMAATPLPTAGRTFEPSRARRIWRFAQPALWLAGCAAAVAVGQPGTAVALGVLALIFGAMAWRQRGESICIVDGVLRHTTRARTRSVDLQQLTRVTYELMPGKFPIPPRSLWLTGSSGGVCVGHRGSWLPGQWDELLRELAPWVAGVDRSQPAFRLFKGVTGCVAGLPDGRPGLVSEDRRHVDCPHPELCDPATTRSGRVTQGRVT
jgi:hypothetical protein